MTSRTKPTFIKSRDDLSFTLRDRAGRLHNWVTPTTPTDIPTAWHECYSVGAQWFEEVVALAHHNPTEAHQALISACFEIASSPSGQGYAIGFLEQLSKWAVTGISQSLQPTQIHEEAIDS